MFTEQEADLELALIGEAKRVARMAWLQYTAFLAQGFTKEHANALIGNRCGGCPVVRQTFTVGDVATASVQAT